MLNEILTPLGLDDPAATISSFNDSCTETLIKLREAVTSPHNEKLLKTWGIVDAAKLIGTTAPTLRKLESEDSTIGPALRDDNNRRYYTLERINSIRDHMGTRYKRPSGTQPMKLAVTNFKGGCAKTTTTVHLAQKCALEGLKTLLVDLDPQGTATFISTGLVPDLEIEHEETIYLSLMDNPNAVSSIIRKTHFDGLDIIPGNLALQDLELGLPNSSINNTASLGPALLRLKNTLEQVEHNYDVIIMDCGPNLGILTINAITASNGILIPIPPSMFDYASFAMLTGTLKNLFEDLNPKYDLFRLLLTKHPGNNEANQVENMLRTQFGGYILTNHMCETIELSKASNDLGSIYEIDKPRGSRDAYKRALQHLEDVNNEIISAFKMIWQNQANNIKAKQEQLKEEQI